MTHTKLILAALCLSALSLCAVSSASAATVHECKKFPPSGTGAFFSDSNCTNPDFLGAWELESLGLNPVNLKGTHTSSSELSATVGGVLFRITCTGLETSGTTVDNQESGGEMFVNGEGKTKFTGCSVTAPVGKGCTVPATIETVNLSSKSNASAGIKFQPASGEKIVTIPVGGATCPAALKGEKELKGSLTSKTETSQTQAFTSTSGSEVTYGGQTATYTSKYHTATNDGTIVYTLNP